MNVISILALVFGLLTQLACKPSKEASEQSHSTPKLDQVEKIEIRNLEKKPLVGVNDLKIDGLSLSVHSIGNNKAALVSFNAGEGVAEYYQYEFCPQKNPGACTMAWYHESNFIVPGLKPGAYKFTIKACTRKEKAATESCGVVAESHYQQIENLEDQLAAKISRFFYLLPKTQDISFKVYNALLNYKQQLKIAGHESPKDETEIAIDNILELGPYQNSAYYLSDGFDTVRNSILQQRSDASSNLLLTETDYEKYHKKDPNEPSTFGKIMILGGLAAVVAGFGQFPNFYETSPQKQLDDYQQRVDSGKEQLNKKTIEHLRTQIDTYPTAKELQQTKSKKYRKGFIIIVAGFASFFTGFATSANLTEDTNSLESVRSVLLTKLEALELELLKIVRERQVLAEEIPF